MTYFSLKSRFSSTAFFPTSISSVSRRTSALTFLVAALFAASQNAQVANAQVANAQVANAQVANATKSSTRFAAKSAMKATFSRETRSSAQTGELSATATSATAMSFTNAPESSTRQRLVLANGVTLLMQTDRLSPRVAISVLVRAGAADETPQNAGWRRLLVEAMLRSTQNSLRSTATISKAQRDIAADELGGKIGAGVSDDAIEFWISGESQNAVALLDLLLQTLRLPSLAQNDVDSARRSLDARRDLVADDVTTLATAALSQQLFADADGKPLVYALPPLGTKESLAALSSTRLRVLWSRFFRANRVFAGASGDLDEMNVKARFAALNFGANEKTPDIEDAPPLFAALKNGAPLTLSRASIIPGDWVFVSYRLGSTEETRDDAPALSVLTAALGASPVSHLSRRFLLPDETAKSTDKSGADKIAAAPQILAQQASSAFTPRRFGGDITIFALTGAATAAQLQSAIEEEAERLRAAPLSGLELQNARQFAIGDWALGAENLHDRAFRLASDEAISLHDGASSSNAANRISSTQFAGADWISRLQSVSAADVQRVAQLYLTEKTVVIVRAAS